MEHIQKMPDAVLVSTYRAVCCQTGKYKAESNTLISDLETEIDRRNLDIDKMRGDTGYATRTRR